MRLVINSSKEHVISDTRQPSIADILIDSTKIFRTENAENRHVYY